MNGYNPKGSYILLLTVHVSLKILDFIHQCAYTDIMFYFLYGIWYYVPWYKCITEMPLSAYSFHP